MKKFSKLFESKSDLLTKVGTSEDELKDMCSDLIDEGYVMSIDIEYIGIDGGIYRNDKETSKFYPSIEIDLHRSTEKQDEHGDRTTKDNFDDVRKWNGGVYYEDNINILKIIYEICHRFESTFTSDKANVYFSLRSINEVKVRITFELTEGQSMIDFKKVSDLISSVANMSNDMYYFKNAYSWGDGKTKNLKISVKRSRESKTREYIHTLLQKGEHDNIPDISSFVKECISSIFSAAQRTTDAKLQMTQLHHTKHDLEYHITTKVDGENIILIQFSGDYDVIFDDEIVVARGIFKDKKEKIKLYDLDLNIKLIY